MKTSFVKSTAGLRPVPASRSQINRTGLQRRATPVVFASASVQENASSIDEAVNVLRQAANTSSVPPVQVFQALRTLDKAKLSTEGWDTVLGGTQSPGKRWRLVFTTGTKEVQAALKGMDQGSGKYFPLTAVQRWDGEKGQIENGIFLGHIAAMTFVGPYSMKSKKLSFDFDTLNLKLGPAKFAIPLKQKITNYVPSPKDPFFLFFYVDENLVAAKGRSGGWAVWARTNQSWELKNGVVS